MNLTRVASRGFIHPFRRTSRRASITPEGGYVGTQFAYLGNYSAVTLQDGCHEVTAIIAEESRSMVDKEQIERQLRYAMAEYDVGPLQQDNNIRNAGKCGPNLQWWSSIRWGRVGL